jgi:hypothetical protein
MARLEVADGGDKPQLRTVAVNIHVLSKQLRMEEISISYGQ